MDRSIPYTIISSESEPDGRYRVAVLLMPVAAEDEAYELMAELKRRLRGEDGAALAAIAATLGCPVGEVAGRIEKLERGARLAYTLIERVNPHLDWGDQGSAWAAHRLVGLGLGLIQPDAPAAPHAGDSEATNG